jgi:hypothetical protein
MRDSARCRSYLAALKEDKLMLKPQYKFESGNTFGKGRPKGARNKVAAKFFDTLLRVMDEPVLAEPGRDMTKLEESMRSLYKTRPLEFLKMITSTLPTEIQFDSPVHNMSDEELAAALEQVRQSLHSSVPLLEAPRDENTAH